MMRVKVVETPELALLALWPRLQAMAVEPVMDESDFVERRAFQGVAFEAQFMVRQLGVKPDQIAPGWDEHYVTLVRENGRASATFGNANSPAGRLETRRHELAARNTAAIIQPLNTVAVPAAAMPSTAGSNGRLSEARGIPETTRRGGRRSARRLRSGACRSLRY
jgi:hypothetical protein